MQTPTITVQTSEPITEDDRPDYACCLHRPPDEGYDWKPADEGYRTCSPCLDRLRSIMRDVRTRYQRLDPSPGRGGDGSRGAPGFASRSPASDHVIAFTDPRSSQTARVWVDRAGRACCEDERPPVSVRGELDILAWDVAEQLGHDGPDDRADVAALLAWLDGKLDLVTRDAGLSEQVARTVRALQSVLKPLTGEPRPRYIGHCPAVVEVCPDLGFRPAYDADPGVPVTCGARLYAPPRGDRVVCRHCNAKWPREAWEALGRALQAAA